MFYVTKSTALFVKLKKKLAVSKHEGRLIGMRSCSKIQICEFVTPGISADQ